MFLTIYFLILVFIKDNYKLVQYYINSVTVFQFFSLRDSWVPGTLTLEGEERDPRTPKTPSGKQNPNIYF